MDNQFLGIAGDPSDWSSSEVNRIDRGKGYRVTYGEWGDSNR